MANNRMWLRHPGTNKQVLLAKHFGGSWYTSDEWNSSFGLGQATTEKLNAFFEHVDELEGGFNSTQYYIEFEDDDG